MFNSQEISSSTNDLSLCSWYQKNYGLSISPPTDRTSVGSRQILNNIGIVVDLLLFTIIHFSPHVKKSYILSQCHMTYHVPMLCRRNTLPQRIDFGFGHVPGFCKWDISICEWCHLQIKVLWAIFLCHENDWFQTEASPSAQD